MTWSRKSKKKVKCSVKFIMQINIKISFMNCSVKVLSQKSILQPRLMKVKTFKLEMMKNLYQQPSLKCKSMTPMLIFRKQLKKLMKKKNMIMITIMKLTNSSSDKAMLTQSRSSCMKINNISRRLLSNKSLSNTKNGSELNSLININ